MSLQTKIDINKEPHHQIDYDSNLLLLGSCFSENIDQKLKYFKFQSEVNPFGILFQPLAIENLIVKAINKHVYFEDDLISNDGVCYSFEAHSKLRGNSENELIQSLNEQLSLTNRRVKAASHIIITLGTAWVYRHIASDTIVANCHKVPQKQFLKELLSVETIIQSLEAIIELIRADNPNVVLIFTVSPVRHLKDGFVENNRSKAHLLSAIHEVVEPRNKLFYFPSYEIQMDELRDYRFYNSDMVHPSDLAVNIIWDYFTQTWISEEVYSTMNKVDAIQKGLLHKPFNAQSAKHLQFESDLKGKIERLKQEYPQISF